MSAKLSPSPDKHDHLNFSTIWEKKVNEKNEKNGSVCVWDRNRETERV